MRALYQSRFNAIEELREELKVLLKDYDLDQLKQQPSANSWSAMQIINHLILSERSTLAYLNKKIKAEQLPRKTFSTNFRMFLLRILMAGPFKYKAPAPVSKPENGDYDSSFESWNKVRGAMKDFLEDYPESKDNMAIFKHPIAGRISLDQALDFFEMHIKHHRKQINAILKK